MIGRTFWPLFWPQPDLCKPHLHSWIKEKKEYKPKMKKIGRIVSEEGAMRRIDELPAKWIMARERLNVYNKARSIHCQYLTGEILGSMV